MTAPVVAPRRSRRRLLRWSAAAIALVVVLGVGVLRMAPSRYLPWDTASFPDVDAAALTPLQAQIVDVLEEQHRLQRPGTFYSQGVDEAWCANFVSWVMDDVGRPLTNPNSGSWRIPGVYTLTEYYQEQGTFEPVGDYRPVTGDVVLYDNSSWVGQHTNFVVAVDGDTAITVGGNENGRIRVHTVDWSSDSAVVGFGRLAA